MAFFGDNTQDVSGLPQDDTMMQLELKRRLDMAKALQHPMQPIADAINQSQGQMAQMISQLMEQQGRAKQVKG